MSNHKCNCGHDHNKEHNCCGGHHEHHHEEGHSCGCGGNHEHNHEESHGCGCGGNHEHNHDHGEHMVQIPLLEEMEIDFLGLLKANEKLPVARYLIKSTKESDFVISALAPVFLTTAEDSMETIKFTGEFLQVLYNDGFIDFAYGDKLDDYDYAEYMNSPVFKYFLQTIEDAKGKENFLGDTGVLEMGYMQITFEGNYVLESNLMREENDA